MSDRRRRAGAATAVTGATLVAGGGHLREKATAQAHDALGLNQRIALPGRSVLRARGRRGGSKRLALYGAGATMGLVGAPAMGVGSYQALHKRRDSDGFVSQGLAGTRDAVRSKAQGLHEDVPADARAAGVGTSAAAGALGSVAAHRILDRVAPNTRARAALTALSGTATTVGSLPLSSRVTRRVAPGYEVTPTGVKRKKTPPVRPTTRASVVETRAGRGARPDARSKIVPTDRRFSKYADPRTTMDYPGASLTPGQKRARVMAAGGVPVVGDITAASQAARMAPPDQRKGAFASQIGGSLGGSATGAAAGAYGAAALARHDPHVTQRAEQLQGLTRNARARAAQRMPGGEAGRAGQLIAATEKEGPGRIARTIGTLQGSGSKPLARAGSALEHAYRPLAGAGAAAAVGGALGQMVGGQAGGYSGYSLALHREKQRNERLSKAAAPPVPLTQREQVQQLRRKQHNLGWSMANTAAGAAGTGLFVGSLKAKGPLKAKLERGALGTAIGGGAISSITGAKQIRTTRRDLQDQEARMRSQGVIKARAGFRMSTLATRRTRAGALVPVRRRNTVVTKGAIPFPNKRVLVSISPAGERARSFPENSSVARTRMRNKQTRGTGQLRMSRPETLGMNMRDFGKADIKRTLSDDDVKRYSQQYGTRGPLPTNIDRNERMRAYEARYVASGGPKGEQWKHRAATADRVTGGALAVGGASAAAELASRTKAGQKVLHRVGAAPHVLAGAGAKGGLAAGAIGASSELFHRHAQRRQASYSASPAGVAASSLRRMQNYTPQED